MVSRRASSIRTRIKTKPPRTYYQILGTLAEHLPLEQGLRLSEIYPQASFICLAEHLPLEQGLRHCRGQLKFPVYPARRASSIRTRIKTPLSVDQLSLRHFSRRASSIRTRIKTRRSWIVLGDPTTLAEHLPLEQGLRRSWLYPAQKSLSCSQSIFH